MLPGKRTVESSTAKNAWQRHLIDAVRDARELGNLLSLDLSHVPTGFPLLVPRPLIERMQPGDPEDPLLRQVLPVEAENDEVEGYPVDPLEEQAQATGVLRKYQGRALAITTGACAVNCRYCFRRHFPYSEHRLDSQDWTALMASLREDPDARELILSGGDPLTLPDRTLLRLAQAAESIPHLRSLRIHTRLPVVIPQRITADLVALLSDTRLAVTVVIHTNHPRELDDHVAAALEPLRGVAALLNQSVLLRGVNDDARTLERLSWRLQATGVLPYYLHLLDPVRGAAHFAVPEAAARNLINALRRALPGYLVPRLAREEPGAPSKTVLA